MREPADEHTEYEAELGCERKIGRGADDDAERQPDRRADDEEQPLCPSAVRAPLVHPHHPGGRKEK